MMPCNHLYCPNWREFIRRIKRFIARVVNPERYVDHAAGSNWQPVCFFVRPKRVSVNSTIGLPPLLGEVALLKNYLSYQFIL